MRKAAILYDSKFGNTAKIAKALATGMGKEGVNVECVMTDQIDVAKLDEYDLLAIGGPTHQFGLSQPIKEFLERLKGVNLNGKKAFAFGTRRGMRIAGSAGKKKKNN